MPLVMKKDIAFDPVNIAGFGAYGIMFQPDGITHLIKQLRWAFFV
jgi:hypothetical protein